jgi:hypothetical protein
LQLCHISKIERISALTEVKTFADCREPVAKMPAGKACAAMFSLSRGSEGCLFRQIPVSALRVTPDFPNCP